MRRIARPWLVLGLILACDTPRPPGVSGSATQPLIPLPPELSRVLRDYESAWRAGDAKRLASLFTEDGLVLSPGKAAVRGRSDIERFYATSSGALTLTAIAYSAGDSVGYIIGTFGGHDPATHPGKYTLTLRRDTTGRWLIASDMANVSF